jgi:hypothetical protein
MEKWSLYGREAKHKKKRRRFTILLSAMTNLFGLIVINDKQDATILDYLFIPNQPYTFRAMYSLIIRSN